MAAILFLQHLLDRPAQAGSAVPTTKGVRPPAAAAGGAQLGVAGLETGACIAYRPSAGDRGQTVFLDAGHGGPDPGVEGSGLLEKDVTLAVELELMAQLRADGYRVVVSRTADTSVARLTPGDMDAGAMMPGAVERDLLTRVDCANAARAQALLAIHFNGFEDPSAGGSETFFDADRPFAAKSQKLAAAVQDAVVRRLGLDDRGVTPDGQLDSGTLTNAGAAYGHLVELGPPMAGFVDRPSSMPGALVEPLFLTAPDEGTLAATASGRAKIAGALFEGLQTYLRGGGARAA